VNYDNSFVVTIAVTCNLWAPSSGDVLQVAPSTCHQSCHSYC